MIVVSDTSPLNYLVLIGADQVLPWLFGRVLTPPEVLAEMQHAKAPPHVSASAQNPPAWLEVRSPQQTPKFPGLGPGESAAIALARTRERRRPADRRARRHGGRSATRVSRHGHPGHFVIGGGTRLAFPAHGVRSPSSNHLSRPCGTHGRIAANRCCQSQARRRAMRCRTRRNGRFIDEHHRPSGG